MCQCGCGQRTRVPRYSDRANGDVAGVPRAFVKGHNTGPGGGTRAKPSGPRQPRRPRQGPLPAPSPAEKYAVELLGAAEQLVAAVRDDGPDVLRSHIAAALRLPAPDGIDPVEALVTVLAAQVDPDSPRSARVGWADALAPPLPEETAA